MKKLMKSLMLSMGVIGFAVAIQYVCERSGIMDAWLNYWVNRWPWYGNYVTWFYTHPLAIASATLIVGTVIGIGSYLIYDR